MTNQSIDSLLPPLGTHPLWIHSFFYHPAVITIMKQLEFLGSSPPCSSFYHFCRKSRHCQPLRQELFPLPTFYNQHNTSCTTYTWPQTTHNCQVSHMYPSLLNRSGLSSYQLPTAAHPTMPCQCMTWLQLYQNTCIHIILPPSNMEPPTTLCGHCPITWVVSQPSDTPLTPSQDTSGLKITTIQSTCAWVIGLLGLFHRLFLFHMIPIATTVPYSLLTLCNPIHIITEQRQITTLTTIKHSIAGYGS